MAQQQTFRLRARTSINDLVVEKEPVPSAGPYEVLVKVRSVALNYRDYVVATGKYPFKVKESVVPCSDIAGDVVEVGHGVEDIAAGDQVISSFGLEDPLWPYQGLGPWPGRQS